MRTVAIIQARTGSSRLPGKVLLPLLGKPILARVMQRTARSKTVDEVVVATTTLADDDVIADLAQSEGWSLERGSEHDLLDRYASAAQARNADVVVRVTADCPLIDPGIVDETVRAFHDAGVDYASNTLEPRTYPRGLDVEVIARVALEAAWGADRDPASREHVTPHIYRHPARFRLLRVPAAEDHAGHRWCVDTAEDYELVRRLYDALGRDDFGWRDALAVVEAHPGWSDLNRHVAQKVLPPG